MSSDEFSDHTQRNSPKPHHSCWYEKGVACGRRLGVGAEGELVAYQTRVNFVVT